MKRPGHKYRHCRLLAGLLAAVLAASCDHGPEQVAGIDGSGINTFASGPITAFGSIVVNDVHYDVDRAQIMINGQLASVEELAIGQIVTLDAVADAGTEPVAETVDFEANLVGPVQSVDLTDSSLIVLEQEVLTDFVTTFDLATPGGGLDSLVAGDLVEISGFTGSGGTISATRIANAAMASEYRIVGTVADHDEGAFTFSIGDLLIDYSSAGLIDGFSDGRPEDGDTVLAVGSAQSLDDGLVVSRLFYRDDDYSELAGREAEAEGLITRFVSAADFDVAGRPASANADTDYEGGTEADLQLNVKIQVEGQIDSAGLIVASKIEIKDGGLVQQ